MKKVSMIYVLSLFFIQIYSMEHKITESREESEVNSQLKNISDKFIAQERKEYTENFDYIRNKVNINKIIDEISKKTPNELSQVVLFIRNSNQKKPLFILRKIIDKYESDRDMWATGGDFNAKYKRTDYQGRPFVMNKIQDLSGQSAYSIYLELPEALRNALEYLGYVNLNQEVISEIEQSLKNFIINEYKKIPSEYSNQFNIKLVDISNILNKLNTIVENKEILTKFINELGTLSLRFLILKSIMNQKIKTGKPFMISDQTIIGQFNRFPDEIKDALLKNGFVVIVS